MATDAKATLDPESAVWACGSVGWNTRNACGCARPFFRFTSWTGIGIGLYVLLISVSGSAIVYRPELNRKYGRRPVVAIQPGGQMSADDLRRRAQADFPGFDAMVYQSRQMNVPATVTLKRGGEEIERFFDPYTGADLGATRSNIQRTVEFVTDLHDNLLLGTTGRTINGIGSILVTVLAATGLVLWWPGIKNWRRSLKIKWNARFADSIGIYTVRWDFGVR